MDNFLTAKEWEEQFGAQYFEWKSSGWNTSHEKTRKFLKHLHAPSNPGISRLFLLPHQFESLQRLVYNYEHLNIEESLATLATGTGKTVVIAASIAWLMYRYENEQPFDSFLILCPNTIVRDRLKSDFLGNKIFHTFSLFPRGAEPLLESIKPLVVSPESSTADLQTHNLFVANRHQFQKGTTNSANQLLTLKRCKRKLAIINDEAHNTLSAEFSYTINFLRENTRDNEVQTPFRFDLTATPTRADGKRPHSNEMYELTVLEAIEGSYQHNRYIDKTYSYYPKLVKKVEVFQTQNEYLIGHNLHEEKIFYNKEDGRKFSAEEINNMSEVDLTSSQIMMEPGVMKLQLKASLDELEKKKSIAANNFKPLLFVITPSIAGAHEAKRMLQKEFKMNPLIVVGDNDSEPTQGIDKEELRRLSTEISSFDSPYDSVISVYMLREGWDVPEVSVMCLLRGFGSKLFAHQVIGRGLRLIRNKETYEPFDGIDTQTCVVVDHPALKLDWLWKDFGVDFGQEKGHSEPSGPTEPLPEQILIDDHIWEELLCPSPIDNLTNDLESTKVAFDNAFKKIDGMNFDWVLTGGKIHAAKVGSSGEAVHIKDLHIEEEDAYKFDREVILNEVSKMIRESINTFGQYCKSVNQDVNYFYQKAITHYGTYVLGEVISKADTTQLFRLIHNFEHIEQMILYHFISELLDDLNKNKKGEKSA